MDWVLLCAMGEVYGWLGVGIGLVWGWNFLGWGSGGEEVCGKG